MAALFLLGSTGTRPGGPSPSGARVAGAASASPTGSSASPGSIGTAATSPSPSASLTLPSASASPAETFFPSFEPDDPDDPGPIIFGAGANTRTFRIIGAATTFRLQHTISWRAELSEPAGATSLQLQIVRVLPTGSEEVVVERTDSISNTRAQILLRRHRLSALVRQPGDYVVRYLRDDTILAEGTITVTP